MPRYAPRASNASNRLRSNPMTVAPANRMTGRRSKYGTASIIRTSSASAGGLLGLNPIVRARGLRQANASAGETSPSKSRNSLSLSGC